MTVKPMWKCDRDGKLFADKRSAEEYEKLLDLAENITQLLKVNFSDIDEDTAKGVGMLISKHKELFLKALKGKPELLEPQSFMEKILEQEEGSASEETETITSTEKEHIL